MAYPGENRTGSELGQALVLLLGAVFVLAFGIGVLGAGAIGVPPLRATR
jgi:hypothetical protein